MEDLSKLISECKDIIKKNIADYNKHTIAAHTATKRTGSTNPEAQWHLKKANEAVNIVNAEKKRLKDLERKSWKSVYFPQSENEHTKRNLNPGAIFPDNLKEEKPDHHIVSDCTCDDDDKDDSKKKKKKFKLKKKSDKKDEKFESKKDKDDKKEDKKEHKFEKKEDKKEKVEEEFKSIHGLLDESKEGVRRAWLQIHTKGSKAAREKLDVRHAKNPEYQEFKKSIGAESDMSVKQATKAAKPVKTTTPTSAKKPAASLSSIRAQNIARAQAHAAHHAAKASQSEKGLAGGGVGHHGAGAGMSKTDFEKASAASRHTAGGYRQGDLSTAGAMKSVIRSGGTIKGYRLGESEAVMSSGDGAIRGAGWVSGHPDGVPSNYVSGNQAEFDDRKNIISKAVDTHHELHNQTSHSDGKKLNENLLKRILEAKKYADGRKKHGKKTETAKANPGNPEHKDSKIHEIETEPSIEVKMPGMSGK